MQTLPHILDLVQRCRKEVTMGFYTANYGDTAANRAKDRASDPTNTYGQVAKTSQTRQAASKTVAPSAPTIKAATRKTPSYTVTAQPVSSPSTPSRKVTAQPVSYSHGYTPSGERVDIEIRNGLSYIKGTSERPSIGTTVETAGGIYKMTSSGGQQVTQHNTGVSYGDTPSAGTVKSGGTVAEIDAGDEIKVTALGAVRGADSQTYTGKGFAYIDKYGFEHVVSSWETAQKYSGDGNTYVYDGTFSGGYAKDTEGNRARVGLPGSKEYGNTLEAGEVTPFAPGRLSSISGNLPVGMYTVASGGIEKIMTYGITADGQMISLEINEQQQAVIPGTGERPPLGTTVQTAGGIFRMGEGGGESVDQHNQAVGGGQLPGQQPLIPGQQPLIPGQTDMPNIGLGGIGGVQAPGLQQIQGGLGLGEQDLQKRIDERVAQNESISSLIREGFGNLKDIAKETIKSRLQAAIEGVKTQEIGLERSFKEERTQADIEKHKALRIMEERAATRGGVTGEERVAQTRVLRESLRTGGEIGARETDAKNVIAGNIKELTASVKAEESAILFQLEQSETEALIEQAQKVGAISSEERQIFLKEIQAAATIQNTLLASEAARISNEVGKIRNQIEATKLAHLPAQLAAEMRQIELEMASMERGKAYDAQRLEQARLSTEQARLQMKVANMDVTNRESAENAVSVFFSAVGQGANVADLQSWLNTNRGSLEQLGLYTDFAKVVTDMKQNYMYPSGMPSIYER